MRRTGEVLSEEEIDQLLNAINAGETETRHFEPRPPFGIKEFEAYLKERQAPEAPYGLFATDISVCSFFDSSKGDEELLADIERKNREQGMGNVKIPNTDITLINYSVCPKCGAIFSFQDLATYYANPAPDSAFKNQIQQFRNDTRVRCHDCGGYFLPSLIISDGTPRNETQFLCPLQTVDAIEQFSQERGKAVLTRMQKNSLHKEGHSAIRNDVSLRDLESKPTLITNLLQYTPPDLMLNLIDGSSVAKGDVLYGAWRKDAA
jgi:hypothetical protein